MVLHLNLQGIGFTFFDETGGVVPYWLYIKKNEKKTNEAVYNGLRNKKRHKEDKKKYTRQSTHKDMEV